MRKPVFTKKFQKELEKCKRRNLKISEIKEVMGLLIANKPLEPKHKNHPLMGDYLGCYECHIRPDWLLVYILDDEENTITFVRTGTHADLF
ncbi:MAG: type II toxin-antitoxin system YafQ family toxin [Methylovulum sp.]|nr:type II toxin-antitoxin system YafQ family toxin [Methylovulum sp.]